LTLRPPGTKGGLHGLTGDDYTPSPPGLALPPSPQSRPPPLRETARSTGSHPMADGRPPDRLPPRSRATGAIQVTVLTTLSRHPRAKPIAERHPCRPHGCQWLL